MLAGGGGGGGGRQADVHPCTYGQGSSLRASPALGQQPGCGLGESGHGRGTSLGRGALGAAPQGACLALTPGGLEGPGQNPPNLPIPAELGSAATLASGIISAETQGCGH